MAEDFLREMMGDSTADAHKLDADLEREIEAALGDMSMEELMEAEQDAAGEAGQMPEGVRRGRVSAIEGDDIFVDFGGKEQGVLPLVQFDEEPLPEIGSMIEVLVERYNASEGLLELSRKGAVQALAWDTMERGQIVEGVVTGHNKGGLELKVNNIRAFMPISQIDIARVENLEPFVGQKLRCKVSEIDRREQNVVLSRRDLLAEEAAVQREQTLATLEVGQVITGRVRTIMPYGAFVDIGGLDGLLHVSDMSYGRVENPGDVVSQGQQVEVKVLKIEQDGGRISLGLKQTMHDPWENAAQRWKVDQVIAGTVTRLADFGAFVEVEPGIEGLVPMGEMTWGRRINHPREVVQQGESVRAMVLSVDEDRKRMSLSLKRVGDDPWMAVAIRFPEGSVHEGTVTRTTDFGAFIELGAGIEGLCHISELADGFVQSVGEAVREGQSVKVRVLSVEEDRRRIGLSIKQAEVAAREADIPQFQADEKTGVVWQQPPSEQPPEKEKKRKNPRKGGLD